MEDFYTFVDVIIAAFYFIIFYLVSSFIRKSNIEKRSYYRYYVSGLMVKVIGGIGVCLVYVYYYGGGDTIAYYHDNLCISKLFMKDPMAALRYTFYNVDQKLYFSFDDETDWPYFGFDPHSVYVSKLTWVLSLIAFNSFIGQTMLLAFISFFSLWRLYKMFITEFPFLEKGLAFAILYIPSVVFWGSGLLKDTITLSAVALFTSSFYQIMKLRKRYVINSIIILVASWILIKIKPYIFFALMPGVVIWFARYQLDRMKSKLMRTVIAPVLLIVALLLSALFLKYLSGSLGVYALDTVLTRAIDTQHDLKQDYYHGASFDIGDIDPSIKGLLSQAPIAVVSALFRPFLWESYSPAMIVSGVENFILLIFTIYLLFRLRIINFFRLVLSNHLLFFCVSFSLFFSFSVGLTTSNFGSLVRYKIPAIPFFVASLLIANHYYQKQKKEKKAEQQLEM